ncbi:MAG: SDR family oxidoreductase [Candidatus Krumholzibacteriia bacterium]
MESETKLPRDRLEGQVALVTGAGRGIGRAIAERCAAAGMRTALLARSRDQLEETAEGLRAAGGEALVLPADVTEPARMAESVARLKQTWGDIHLAVAAAGILSSIGPLWETDPDEWRDDLLVNVFGVYCTCRAVVPHMVAAGRGRVIALVGGGVHAPFPHVSAYAAGKAGVMRLVENLAVELDAAASPVRVLAVTPGFIRTGMTEQFAASERGRRWMKPMAERLETGRDTTPDHVADLVIATAGGRLDAFHGRFLSAPQDAPRLDRLPAEGQRLAGTDGRKLRIEGFEKR